MYTILVIGHCSEQLSGALKDKFKLSENIEIKFSEKGQERFQVARKGLYDGNILLIFPEVGVPGIATESAGLQKIPVIVCNMDGKLDHWLDYLQSEDAKLAKHFNINCFNPVNSQLNFVLHLEDKKDINATAEKIFLTIANLLLKYPRLMIRLDDTPPTATELQALMDLLKAQNKDMQFPATIQSKKPTASIICAAHPLKTIAFNGYELGSIIGKTGFDFVNGAGGKKAGKLDEDQPLMYQTAYGAKRYGASNTGVITPFECIKYEKNNDLSIYDNLIFVNNLSERIKTFSMADVVIVGPGGTGTMDEFWALNSNRIIILNIDGFYDNLKKYLSTGLMQTKSIKFIDNLNQFEVLLCKLHKEIELQYQNELSNHLKLGIFNNASEQKTDIKEIPQNVQNLTVNINV